MVITQGQLTYIFRGKEMSFDFFPVQPLERLGVTIRGARSPIADGYRFTLTLTPSEEIVLKSLSIDIATDLNQHSRVFVNGFQSRTESREFDLREKIPRLRWPASRFAGYSGDHTFYRSPAKPGRFHGWTYAYSRGGDGNIVLYGSVSEKPGYTLFEYETGENFLRVSRDCVDLKIGHSYTALDIVVLPGREDDVFDIYFREIESADEQSLLSAATASPELADSRPSVSAKCSGLPPASGWTSWHNHFTRISEPVVLANLAEIKKRDVPLDYFLIDDGWQRGVGDWLTPNSEFPNGMKRIALAVKESGYRPGLWIAPFICARWSGIWRHHRDWVLRDKGNKPVRAAWNSRWGGEVFTLDLYNPEFRAYLKQVFDTILGDWGFDLVKTDYLYAAGLRPRVEKTRGQIMCEAMELIQYLTGDKDKTLLAAGVPLGCAMGKVSYCRTGSNVGLSWEDKLQRALGNRERVSTFNSITSLIGRRHLHGRAFAADPDAFILRTGNQKMTPGQKKTLFRLNLVFGGLSFMSDNPAEYTEEELELYYSAFPLREKKVLGAEFRRGAWIIRFEVEERQYLLLVNLTSRPREFRIDPGVYFDPDVPGFRRMEVVDEVKPFDSKCFLSVPDREWEVAGSTGHIFPGCEVEASVAEDGAVNLSVHPHVRYKTEVFVRVPGNLQSCLVNGTGVQVERTHDLAYIRVKLDEASRMS